MALTHHDTRHSSMKRIWDSCYSIFSLMCMLCRLLSVRFLLAHLWCCLSFFFWPICGVVCPSSFGPSVVLSVLFLLAGLWCCFSFFFWPICGVVCPSSFGPSVVLSVRRFTDSDYALGIVKLFFKNLLIPPSTHIN